LFASFAPPVGVCRVAQGWNACDKCPFDASSSTASPSNELSMCLRLDRVLSLVAVLLATVGLVPAVASAQRLPPRPTSSLPGEDPAGARVIVKFKALGTLMRELRASGRAAEGPRLAATLGARHGIALTDGRPIQQDMQVMRGDTSLSSAALAARLAADAEVEFAVPDYRRYPSAAPNDPLYAASNSISPAAGQWYLRPPDSTFISAIDAEGAWNITIGSANVVVADLDTGIRPDHPDLANKLFIPTAADKAAGFTGPFVGWDFISAASNSNSGAGRGPDASDPGDWSTANECGRGQAAQPSSWHGTQTAGLIGAQTNNGIGMASVGYQVMLLPVRVLGTCGGSDSDISAAMLWAAGIAVPGVPANPHPARVINMSLGASGSCAASVYPAVISQVAAAGVSVVVAAGNEEGGPVDSPANCSGVIAVAALRNVGTKVGFSSIGPEVALSAPGGNCINSTGACLYPILTTTNSGTTTPVANDASYTDSNNPSLGTSFSTPLVSGTVALMLSVSPSLTPAQVRAVLHSTARTFPTASAGAATQPPQCVVPTTNTVQDECICTTSTCGAGMLDAAAAVASAAASTPPPSVGIGDSASTAVVGSSVTFTGNATAPSATTITSYQWSLVGGSTIAAFSGPTNGASATVTTSAPGTFAVTLTVTDSAGVSASATSSAVTVNAPAAPSAKIVASSTAVAAGTAVTLDGSESTANSPAQVAGYQWQITSQSPSGLAQFTSATNASSATVATAGSSSGSFTVQLTVTDTFNQTSSATQSIAVTPLAPTAVISESAVAVNVGGSVTFDGSASTGPGGRTISSYQWSLTSGGNIAAFTGSTTGSTATAATSGAGTFTVALTVTDNAGATATRSSTVTVNAVTGTGSGSGGGSSGSGSGGGGSGGGAMSPLWMLGLAIVIAALARRRHR
jgi:serine protease